MEHPSSPRNRSLLRAGKRMLAAIVRTNRPLMWCVVSVMCARAPPSVGFTSPGKVVVAPVQGAGDCFYSKERRLALSTIGDICTCSSSAHGSASKEKTVALAALGDHRPSRLQSRCRARISARALETPIGVERSRRTRHNTGRSQRGPEPPQARLGSGGRGGSAKRSPASDETEGAKSRVVRGSGSVVNFYMNNLKQYRLLDASEELALGRDIQKGVRCELVRDRLEARQGSVPTHDEWAAALGVKTQELLADLDAAKRAKRAMISANLRLVVSVAKRYRCKGIAFPDLIQEGTFGLVRASEKFDPELGFKFSTYATWWIKQSIMNGIGEHSRVIRLPVHVHTFLNSVRRSSTTMAVNGRDPSDDEIGERLNTTAKKIQFYRNAAAMTSSISLDARIGGKSSSGERASSDLSDVVGEGDSPEDLSHTADLRGKVMAMLETLDYREQKVVRARYGLDGLDPRTLEEIGREFDITRERVRQIESRAMSKLRQPYRNYRLRDHASGHQAGITGGFQSKQEAVGAAVAMIAEKESAIKACSSKSSSGRSRSSDAVPCLDERGGLGVSVERPLVAAEQRSREIESKRRLLDKVWNQESEAMLHRLERELALSEQEALTLAP